MKKDRHRPRYRREWYLKNRERILARNKTEDRRAYKREYAQRWLAKNKDHMREYRKKHRDKLRKKSSEYFQSHKEQINARKRWLRQNDPVFKERANRLSRESMRKHKERRRAVILKYEYGLTPTDLEAMKGKQNGQCAICGKEKKRLVIDHCHLTGKVRALLCTNCNFGIGFFQDSAQILRGAIKYLRLHSVRPM